MKFDKIQEKLNSKKIAAIVVAVLVFVQIASVVFVSESFLNTERFSKSERAKGIISQQLSSQEDIKWLKNKSESVSFNNGELSGLYVKNNSTSHSYIIIFHPLTTEPADMASYAFHFYELGFNIYIPQYIGKSLSMGIKEQETVAEWANYVAESDESANIFLFGAGVGGTSVLLSTGNSLPENVRGIVADSVYSDIGEVFKENIGEFYGLHSFPTVSIASVYTKLTRGWSFSQADVLGTVRNSKLPILYIHGTEDSIVPVGQSNELFEVTRAKGTNHITIYGADHVQTLNTDSEKYWREVDEFIRKSMDF